MQFADNTSPDQPAFAQADLGIHGPLTGSLDIVVSVDEQRMSRSDCTYAHAQQDLHCSHTSEGNISLVANHMIVIRP